MHTRLKHRRRASHPPPSLPANLAGHHAHVGLPPLIRWHTEIVATDVAFAAARAPFHCGFAVALEALEAGLAVRVGIAVALAVAALLARRAATKPLVQQREGLGEGAVRARLRLEGRITCAPLVKPAVHLGSNTRGSSLKQNCL